MGRNVVDTYCAVVNKQIQGSQIMTSFFILSKKEVRLVEKEIKVAPYGLIQICEDCKKGEMLPTGEWHMTSPPKFEHQCNRCLKKKYYNQKYPEIKFRRES